MYTYVGNKDGVTSVAYMFRNVKNILISCNFLYNNKIVNDYSDEVDDLLLEVKPSAISTLL